MKASERARRFRQREQENASGDSPRLFSIALGLALLGGVGFAVALSAAFGRWGTGWEDGLAFASIALLVMAALLNLLAAAMALGAIARRRRVRPWQAVSLLLAVLSLAWGVVLAGM